MIVLGSVAISRNGLLDPLFSSRKAQRKPREASPTRELSNPLGPAPRALADMQAVRAAV